MKTYWCKMIVLDRLGKGRENNSLAQKAARKALDRPERSKALRVEVRINRQTYRAKSVDSRAVLVGLSPGSYQLY